MTGMTGMTGMPGQKCPDRNARTEMPGQKYPAPHGSVRSHMALWGLRSHMALSPGPRGIFEPLHTDPHLSLSLELQKKAFLSTRHQKLLLGIRNAKQVENTPPNPPPPRTQKNAVSAAAFGSPHVFRHTAAPRAPRKKIGVGGPQMCDFPLGSTCSPSERRPFLPPPLPGPPMSQEEDR